MKHEAGTRVFAIAECDDVTVRAFGYGTYVGDQVNPELAAGWGTPAVRAVIERSLREADENPIDCSGWYQGKVATGEITQEECDGILARAAEAAQAQQATPIADRVNEAIRKMSLNPKIVLDAGGVVWGCECWWSAAADGDLERYAKGREIVLVSAPHPAEPAEAVER